MQVRTMQVEMLELQEMPTKGPKEKPPPRDGGENDFLDLTSAISMSHWLRAKHIKELVSIVYIYNRQ